MHILCITNIEYGKFFRSLACNLVQTLHIPSGSLAGIFKFSSLNAAEGAHFR